MGEKEKKKEQRKEDLLNAGIAGANYETIQRYGAAVKEHYVAYSGYDNELGNKLSRGLKDIAKNSKVNPDYKNQNIRQQAGFSAEIKSVANDNAENIINKNPNRRIRTDDLGRVNDPLADTVMLDSKGDIINGSETQLKFLGSSDKDPTGKGDAARALNKLQTKKCQKYFDNDIKIEVPKDQYDDIINEANKRIDKLSKQLENQKKAGNSGEVRKLQDKIDKLEHTKKNLRKSSVTSKEAIFARTHPGLSTAKSVAKLSHKAGEDSAKISALIGGSVSVVRNLVSVCKGDVEPEDAIKNVAKDTASTAVKGYGTGFVGAAIKGAMQNSSSSYVRALSKTNLAGTIVTVAVTATKTLSMYFRGEIDGVECLETLGEEGTGMVASAMFAAIGQAAIPIPIVGGLIGGMVGYALSSSAYGILTQSLKEEKLAKEERRMVEQACEEHIKMIREYRAEVEVIINKYLIDSMDVFRESFSGIKNALDIGDVDWVIDSANEITEAFGGNSNFKSMDEFNDKMLNRVTFKL